MLRCSFPICIRSIGVEEVALCTGGAYLSKSLEKYSPDFIVITWFGLAEAEHSKDPHDALKYREVGSFSRRHDATGGEARKKLPVWRDTPSTRTKTKRRY